LMPKRIR